jgi:hypothetical protein
MIYVTNDPNYDSESEKQNADASVERICDITPEPVTNEAVDTNEASKIANLLQGLRFPAPKNKLKNTLQMVSLLQSVMKMPEIHLNTLRKVSKMEKDTIAHMRLKRHWD